MTLNKATGNMFPFVSHTWNPLGGKCIHDCPYCYVRRQLAKPVLADKYNGDPRFVGKAWSPHGTDKVIFVEDMGDLFARNVSPSLIERVRNFAWAHPGNTYLFLSKNPSAMIELIRGVTFAPKIILGTTIERDSPVEGCTAPTPVERIRDLKDVRLQIKFHHPEWDVRYFLSFEPIMKFSFLRMQLLTTEFAPDFIAIGADSGENGLEEPTRDEVIDFAGWASNYAGTDKPVRVYLKQNLDRIVGKKFMQEFEAREKLKDGGQ